MSLLVLGATSRLATEVAKQFHRNGHSLFLMAREPEKIPLQLFEGTNCKKVEVYKFDITDKNRIADGIEAAIGSMRDDPYVLVAIGKIFDSNCQDEDIRMMEEVIDVNFKNIAIVLGSLASHLKKKKKGSIIVISSVAGDRGRQSNYVYGAAKAGLTAFASGLRNRLYSSGVNILTVKPGYVDTPMFRTAVGDKKNKIPDFLICSPEEAGKQIYRGAVLGKKVIYVSRIWKWIMFLVRVIPESLFVRLHL
jgi:decaprenylphospho-beta-D-erythro-pentofuranosid-2-ulose 2-reductase